MTIRTDDTRDRDSLNWLAVQYVLGELHESEACAFEERLAVDLVACEAVAAATRLTLCLRIGADQLAVSELPMVALPDQAVRRVGVKAPAPRGSWLALAGATMAAAGLLVAMSLGPVGSRYEPLAQVDQSASELVSLWRAGSSTAVPVADESDAEVDESNHEVAVPNWLFAAVSLEQAKPVGEPAEDWQEN